MLTIGLTGGIGCGKNTVCDEFKKLNVPIVDSDVIARECVVPGSQALKQIHTRWGDSVLKQDGSLNRVYLRTLIFSQPNERRWLEQRLHPLIRAALQAQVKAQHSAYVITVIPLLLESMDPFKVDRILVIDLPEALQRKRASQRDHTSEQHIQAIMDTQVTRTKRLNAAHDVIDNRGSPRDLTNQVKALHETYLRLVSQV